MNGINSAYRLAKVDEEFIFNVLVHLFGSFGELCSFCSNDSSECNDLM